MPTIHGQACTCCSVSCWQLHWQWGAGWRNARWRGLGRLEWPFCWALSWACCPVPSPSLPPTPPGCNSRSEHLLFIELVVGPRQDGPRNSRSSTLHLSIRYLFLLEMLSLHRSESQAYRSYGSWGNMQHRVKCISRTWHIIMQFYRSKSSPRPINRGHRKEGSI